MGLSLKTAAAMLPPRLLALACIPADWRAALNPASELNLLPLLVNRGDVTCDVGANRGLYTYWLLRLGARVTAFEPNPEMVRLLRLRFTRELREGRLVLFDMAASGEDGSAVLHVPRDYAPLATLEDHPDAPLPDVADVTVARRRLDDCLVGPVDFIKIDVEGHEEKALQGAMKLLSAHKPTLLIEAEERHRRGALASLRRLLEPLGYEGFFALSGGMQPVSAFDPLVHQRVDALNGEGTAALNPFGYINNFVFTARPQHRERLRNWKPSRALLGS